MSCKDYLESLHLRVEKSKARGRFLVTSEPIPAGTTILTCKPLSFAISNDKQNNVCCNCYRVLPKLSACSKCNYAHYCCRQCQVADWKNHKKECSWMKKLVDRKMPMNSCVIVVRMLYQICTHEAVHSFENGVMTGDYTDILDHCDNLNLTEESIRKGYEEVAAVIIHDVVKDEPWYKEDVCPVSVITACISRMYNNRFSVMDFENTEIAIGLYPIAYLINHRCMPNATFVFDGVTLQLRSTSDIHRNEEINISYIDIAKPTFIRNKILKDGYGFRCNCPLCKNLQRDKQLYSFKCRCGGAMLPTIEDGSKRPELWKCEKCGKEGYFADEYRIIEDEQCYSLLIWLQTDDGGYSYKHACELFKEYKEKCTEDNFLFIKLLQYLLTYFIAMKRAAECEEICGILLRFMNKYQVHNSRALLQEYISFGKLDKGLGKHSSALKYYGTALEIARITDGENSPIYNVVKGLMADVDFAYNGKTQKVIH